MVHRAFVVAAVLWALGATAGVAGALPTPPSPSFFSPQPSPDGASQLWECLDRGGSIWLTDGVGREPVFLRTGHSPSWDGPRAFRFVVSRDDGHRVLQRDLFRCDLETGDVTLVSRDSDNPEYATVVQVGPPAGDPRKPLSVTTVCLDPGHGKDTGACCPFNDAREDGYVLASAYEVKGFLEDLGATVRLTRVDNSTEPGLTTRVNFSNACGARVFVSIHYNSAENPKARGLETYYRDGDAISKAMAQQAHDGMQAASGCPSRGVRADKPTLGFTLGVLSTSHATRNKALTEGAFLSNADDAALLRTPEFTRQLSWGIYAGICRVLKVEPVPLGGSARPCP